MTEKPDGNGARAALIEIVDNLLAALAPGSDDIDRTADHILAKLAEAGYVIKPIVEH